MPRKLKTDIRVIIKRARRGEALSDDEAYTLAMAYLALDKRYTAAVQLNLDLRREADTAADRPS